MFGSKKIRYAAVADGQEEHVFKPVDHFGNETRYLSVCILEDRRLEADGEEGRSDMHMLAAAGTSPETGETIALAPNKRSRWIEADQAVSLKPARQPSEDELVSLVSQSA